MSTGGLHPGLCIQGVSASGGRGLPTGSLPTEGGLHLWRLPIVGGGLPTVVGLPTGGFHYGGLLNPSPILISSGGHCSDLYAFY